jgi:uncharacterized repeat protein (TIGR03806 family)
MSVRAWPLLALGIATTAAVGLAAASCATGDVAAPGSPTSPGAESAASPTEGPPRRARYGLDTRPLNATCKAPPRPPAGAAVKLEKVFGDIPLVAPIGLAQMPGDPSRMFVAQRGVADGGVGDIVAFPVAGPLRSPVVVGSVGPLAAVDVGEGGLLGMAFHPGCTAASCRLYVTWVGPPLEGFYGSRSSVGYLTSTDGGLTFTGLTEVLGFEEIRTNTHLGGGIAFGNDGLLYLGFGDASGGDDGFAAGQNKAVKSAKILRIDVDMPPPGKTYGIPASNPFQGGGAERSTFAYGFRNPFRLSFDRATGDLFVGDVGQNRWEEIDRVERGGNYGWPCREGAHAYLDDDSAKCPSKTDLVDPLVEHEHPAPAGARSVTGGVVYRGKAIPTFVGTYIYGDYSTGEVFTLTLDPSTGQPRSSALSGAPTVGWVQFGEDLDGEVHGISINTGEIFKVVAASDAPAPTFPDRLSKTGCAEPTDVTKVARGLVPFGVNAEQWSDGATSERFFAIPDGTTIGVTAPDGDLELPTGSVVMKTLARGRRRIETQLLVRHDDGEWAGYTYEWLDDQSDARLLPSSKTTTGSPSPWYFADRSACMRCHTQAAGRTLGMELGQLNGDLLYASTNRIASQLETLEHIGMFAAPLAHPATALPVVPAPLGGAPLQLRARAYLHANCAGCHRPGGGARGTMDLRFSTALPLSGACNVDASTGDLGIQGSKLLVPSEPQRSLISLRARTRGPSRMPPLATSVVDTEGMAVVDAWIGSLSTCP